MSDCCLAPKWTVVLLYNDEKIQFDDNVHFVLYYMQHGVFDLYYMQHGVFDLNTGGSLKQQSMDRFVVLCGH